MTFEILKNIAVHPFNDGSVQYFSMTTKRLGRQVRGSRHDELIVIVLGSVTGLFGPAFFRFSGGEIQAFPQAPPRQGLDPG
jgi:hypothetical protein